ncbi:HAT protein [Hirschfeldia incana]|nr:HAT protein [Hirschfeldia incana]
MDPNPPEVVDNTVSSDSQQPPPTTTTRRRSRKRKSMVWDHFTTEATSSETTKALCKHCNKSYAFLNGAKASGTSHLKRHIELGICAKCPNTDLTPQVNDESPPPKKRQGSSLDQDRCNREMAKMIIMHDYPLHMVEDSGFAGFLKALRPQYSMASFDTIHGDCVSMFLSRKERLLELVGEIPGGVNLTVDVWSSKQSVGYAFVTGHFVDKDWNLSRCLLNVAVVACPDSDSALNQPVAACLSDWKLEGKVSSLAVSQALVNKTCVESLRGFLSFRNQHVLNGQLLMGRCYARVLSSMAQDALAVEQLQVTIKKVRDSIKFVKTNDDCGDKFDELKRLFPTEVPYKDLLFDNQTRWDTSYNMLVAACEHRQVFSCLETCYPQYKISISPEEWRKVESLCSCLKVFFEAGKALTRPNHVTANELFDEMNKLQLELSHVAMGEEDVDIRNIANSLREKFDLYWRGCFLVLAVAVVMDPRFKMRHIKDTFTNAYGEDAEDWIKSVSDAIHDLFINYSQHNLDDYVDHEYSEIEVPQEPDFQPDIPQDANTGSGQSVDETSPPHVEQTIESCPVAEEEHASITVEQTTVCKVEKQNVEGVCEVVSEEHQRLGDESQAHTLIEEEEHTLFMGDELLEEGATLVTIEDFEIDMSDMTDMKTEMDQYLDDTMVLMSDSVDVLGWWKLNSINYPTLSKIAVDLLSIPFSTVSPDSVFDTEVKQMDSYKSSLPRVTLEALLCTKDWLKNQTL